MANLAAIANELDRRAISRPFGRLQEIRKELKGLARIPSHRIFSWRKTIQEDGYSFHLGGRTELQFNIGFDSVTGKTMFRDGVAFCLDTGQALPEIDVLIPKIKRFNEFMTSNPDEFADLSMWHYDNKGESSPVYPPGPIPSHLVQPNNTIFFGRLQRSNHINYELVLDDLDRLLSIYRFVEGTDSFPALTKLGGQFHFKPGCTVKAASTKASLAEQHLDVSLRHNEIQQSLYQCLVSQYGSTAVGTENRSGTCGEIDVVVKHSGGYWFYEIKTAKSARGCILDALAQLLEYSYWPGAEEAEQLIIVGEPPLDGESRAFLALLTRRFSLPIKYQQFDVENGKFLDSNNSTKQSQT
jgi:hypothetical protein